jgi:hypothetical protein
MEYPLPSAFGARAVAWVLWDVGEHPGVEHARAIVGGIAASIEMERGTSPVHTDLCGHLLHGV